MMKLRMRILLIACLAAIFCTGCGAKNNENLKAGMEAVAALDYDAALKSFAAGREAGENERLLLRGEGLAYMGKTLYAEAATCFEQALSLSGGRPKSVDYDINYYLATAYYKQGQHQKALQVYDAILALKPQEKDACYLRGVIYAEQENLEKALEDFDRVLAIDPEDYDRMIDIYCVLNANGYKESGQNYLKNAMANGTKGMTNYEKGRISFYLEDYENARNYLERVKDSEGKEAVLFLGRTYETLGDHNYAISVYNNYLKTGKENPKVLNQMGLCKMEMGDYRGALEAFQMAMNIENNGMMQVLKLNEIVAYERLQEYKKAAVLLDSYLKTYPDDEVAAREYIFLKTR